MSLPLLRDNSSMKNSRFCIWVLAILFFLKTILKIKSYSLKKENTKYPFSKKKKKERSYFHLRFCLFVFKFDRSNNARITMGYLDLIITMVHDQTFSLCHCPKASTRLFFKHGLTPKS